MTSELVEHADFKVQPITYPVMKAQIEELGREYLSLRVAGVDDKEGFARVHAARMQVRGLRTSIEKRRKELKAIALEYGRHVDGAAKDLTALIAPIEFHLENEEAIVEREKERLRKIQEEERAAKVKAKVLAFAEVGVILTAYDVEELSEEECVEKYRQAKADFEDRKAREQAEAEERAKREAELAKQEARAKLISDRSIKLAGVNSAYELTALGDMTEEDFHALYESCALKHQHHLEQLAAERAELDRQREEQAEAQAKLDAERKRIEAEQAERVRAATIETAKREAAERAKREAEAEQQRREETAKAAAEERQRLDALRPDHEKLLRVADAVDAIRIPDVSEHAKEAARVVLLTLLETSTEIRHIANELMD